MSRQSCGESPPGGEGVGHDLSDEEGGEAGEGRVDEPFDSPLADRGDPRHRQCEIVKSGRDRVGVEVAATDVRQSAT